MLVLNSIVYCNTVKVVAVVSGTKLLFCGRGLKFLSLLTFNLIQFFISPYKQHKHGVVIKKIK